MFVIKKLIYTHIIDDNYIGIITLLHYELSLRHCLMELSFTTNNYKIRKLVVDLALKTGLNKYRFASYSINHNGRVLLDSGKYISPCNKMVKCANSVIQQNSELLSNSILSEETQKIIKTETVI